MATSEQKQHRINQATAARFAAQRSQHELLAAQVEVLKKNLATLEDRLQKSVNREAERDCSGLDNTLY